MDSRLAGHEQLIRLVAAPGIFERAVLGHRQQPSDMFHVCGAVELQLGVQSFEPIGLAGERKIVQGAVLFELDSVDPRVRHGYFGRVLGFDRLGRLCYILHEMWRLAGAEGGVHGIGVAALEHRLDLDGVLAFVELLDNAVDLLAQRGRHRMPSNNPGSDRVSS